MSTGYRTFLSKYLPRVYGDYGYSLMRGRPKYAYGYHPLYDYCNSVRQYGYQYAYTISEECCCNLCGCLAFMYVGRTGIDTEFEPSKDFPCCWTLRGKIEFRGVDNYPIDTPDDEKSICTDYTRWVYEGCAITCDLTDEECADILDVQILNDPPFDLPKLGRPGAPSDGTFEIGGCGTWDFDGYAGPGTYEVPGCELTYIDFGPLDCYRYCVDWEVRLDVLDNMYWHRMWAHCDVLEQYGPGAGTPPSTPVFVGETYTECFD